MITPLADMRVLSLAVNVPGPVAAARLQAFGAAVTKIEPPGGDPLAVASPAWYHDLCAGQTVLSLDLKSKAGRLALDQLLAESDLLLTSNRPAALAGLALDWPTLRARHPRLCQVAIVGHPAPRDDEAGHDLTYLAEYGLVAPPHLPPTLAADLSGAERAVSAALGLLLGRARGHEPNLATVALGEAAFALAEPLRRGLTTPGGPLGGGLPTYNLYPTRQGWIAVAALEPHFWARLQSALDLNDATYDDLARIFATRDAREWAAWAITHDLPLKAVS